MHSGSSCLFLHFADTGLDLFTRSVGSVDSDMVNETGFYLKALSAAHSRGGLGLGCYNSFRILLFPFRSIDLLDSKSVVPSLTMDLHKFLSIALYFQQSMPILNFFNSF